MSAAPAKALWMVIGAGAAIVSGAITKRALDAGWRAATDDEPPDDPDSLKIPWKEALLWTTVSAVAVGVAQLSARRGAALGWRQVTGKRPPA
jgi:hypothetical protein